MTTKPTFLNVFNISVAMDLLRTGKNYADITNDHVAIVAYDGTVWACKVEGFIDDLRNIRMVERLV